jgi:hypothetical protein
MTGKELLTPNAITLSAPDGSAEAIVYPDADALTVGAADFIATEAGRHNEARRLRRRPLRRQYAETHP